MLQIYALSVAINVIMGIIVLLGKKDEEEGVDSSFLRGNTFTLTITILAGVMAMSTLMAPYKASLSGFSFSAIPVFGDLLIAIATFLGFLVFLTRFLKNNHSKIYTEHNFFSLIERSEFYIAVLCLACAAVHFFFPAVFLL